LFRPTGKWRAQISAAGKTTSLGDHDTEEEAARAFDRAAINIKGGSAALTNFMVSEYSDELSRLVDMTQAELVADLRARARKAGRGASKYIGVTLIKATEQWHAQITVRGKHLHLGFFDLEELAARAYDRAALYFAHSHSNNPSPSSTTNFTAAEYRAEMVVLKELSLSDLLLRITGSSAIRTDVLSEHDLLSGNESPSPLEVGSEEDVPSPKLRTPVVTDLKTGLFPAKKRAAPSLSPVYFPRSKERRTRMQPCRAAC